MGEGWGEGIPQMAATFPSTLTAPIQALRLVALSLTLSHGREDGVAVGIKGSARKQVVQAAFPILATRAGFPPVHRLFAAKFRDSKNAAR